MRITPRQKQILELIATGHTDKEVAQKLAISEHTVNIHLRLAYAALDVNTRAAAVATLSKINEN